MVCFPETLDKRGCHPYPTLPPDRSLWFSLSLRIQFCHDLYLSSRRVKSSYDGKLLLSVYNSSFGFIQTWTCQCSQINKQLENGTEYIKNRLVSLWIQRMLSRNVFRKVSGALFKLQNENISSKLYVWLTTQLCVSLNLSFMKSYRMCYFLLSLQRVDAKKNCYIPQNMSWKDFVS